MNAKKQVKNGSLSKVTLFGGKVSIKALAVGVSLGIMSVALASCSGSGSSSPLTIGSNAVNSARANTAASNLTMALTAASAIAASNGEVLPSSTSALISQLDTQGDGIVWLAGGTGGKAPSPSTNQVSVYAGSNGAYAVFAAVGVSGKCDYTSAVFGSASNAPSSTPGSYYASTAIPSSGCIANSGVTGWTNSSTVIQG